MTNFVVTFTHERTGETRTFEFSLSEYVRASQWLEHPITGIDAAFWLNESNLNRQTAFSAVLVWRNELKQKGAP